MESSEMDPLKGLHLLVVDDSELILQLIARHLKKWGVGYVTLDNASDAIHLIKKGATDHPDPGQCRSFDLVLMDLHLPGMDGSFATSEILKIHPELPVIAMTGDESAPAIFSDYLRKPIHPEELHEKLCQILGRT